MNKIYLNHNDKIQFKKNIYDSLFEYTYESFFKSTLTFYKKINKNITSELNIIFPKVLSNIIISYFEDIFAVNYDLSVSFDNYQYKVYYTRFVSITLYLDGITFDLFLDADFYEDELTLKYEHETKFDNIELIMYEKNDVLMVKKGKIDDDHLEFFNVFMLNHYGKKNYISDISLEHSYEKINENYIVKNKENEMVCELQIIDYKKLKNVIVIFKIIMSVLNSIIKKKN